MSYLNVASQYKNVNIKLETTNQVIIHSLWLQKFKVFFRKTLSVHMILKTYPGACFIK